MQPTSDDYIAIANLLARYCLLLDQDDIDGCVELFVPEGSFEVYGRSFDGHDGLRLMMAGAPPGLHLGGHPLVETVEAGAGEARTMQNLLFVDRDSGESRRAVYTDRVVRTPAGWRFVRRRCRFILAGGLSDRPDRLT